jgi:hypothetical protein
VQLAHDPGVSLVGVVAAGAVGLQHTVDNLRSKQTTHVAARARFPYWLLFYGLGRILHRAHSIAARHTGSAHLIAAEVNPESTDTEGALVAEADHSSLHTK